MRENIVRSLGQLGDLRAAPTLRRLLSGPASSLRKTTAEALGQLQDAEAVPALLDLLAQDLAQLGSTNSQPPQPLRAPSQAILLQPVDGELAGVIRALAQIADPRAVDALAKVLDAPAAPPGYEDPHGLAVAALGDIGDPRALPILEQIASANTNLSSAAIRAIGEIGDPSAGPWLLQHLDRLQSETESGEDAGQATMMDHLLRALGTSRTRQALPTLLEQAQAGRPRDHRVTAVEALGLLGDPQAIPVLAEALKSREETLRQEACWSLGFLGHADAVSPLTNVLHDRAFEIRFAASFSLAIIHHPRAIPTLSSLLNDKDRRVALAAACSLAFHDATNALAPLVRASHAKEPWERFAAGAALLRLGSPPALEAVRQLQHDPKPALRQFAAIGLAQGLTPALTQTLQGREQEFRHYAARLLAFHQDPVALPTLRHATRDPRPDVRKAARVTITLIERPHGPASP